MYLDNYALTLVFDIGLYNIGVMNQKFYVCKFVCSLYMHHQLWLLSFSVYINEKRLNNNKFKYQLIRPIEKY